jgi:membrane associated rhomboid family serine protease
MIPLRDNLGARRLAPANTFLILVNLVVFGYELKLGSHAKSLLSRLGMEPARLLHSADRAYVSVWPPATLVTSLFLHGGFLHIASNMLYLFIFGAAVEARMGHLRYLLFYLAAGVASGLAMVWMEPSSRVPVVGASGAIAGVLGAYFILFPRARILTILPLFIFIELIEVPAILYLLFWFALQLYYGVASGSTAHGAMMGGVAWWAHVGGFLFGVTLGPWLAKRKMRRQERSKNW